MCISKFVSSFFWMTSVVHGLSSMLRCCECWRSFGIIDSIYLAPKTPIGKPCCGGILDWIVVVLFYLDRKEQSRWVFEFCQILWFGCTMTNTKSARNSGYSCVFFQFLLRCLFSFNIDYVILCMITVGTYTSFFLERRPTRGFISSCASVLLHIINSRLIYRSSPGLMTKKCSKYRIPTGHLIHFWMGHPPSDWILKVAPVVAAWLQHVSLAQLMMARLNHAFQRSSHLLH